MPVTDCRRYVSPSPSCPPKGKLMNPCCIFYVLVHTRPGQARVGPLPYFFREGTHSIDACRYSLRGRRIKIVLPHESSDTCWVWTLSKKYAPALPPSLQMNVAAFLLRPRWHLRVKERERDSIRPKVDHQHLLLRLPVLQRLRTYPSIPRWLVSFSVHFFPLRSQDSARRDTVTMCILGSETSEKTRNCKISITWKGNIQSGAATCSEGFVICLLKVPPDCAWAAWQLQYNPTACWNLRKHFTKPSEQVAAPDCTDVGGNIIFF